MDERGLGKWIEPIHGRCRVRTRIYSSQDALLVWNYRGGLSQVVGDRVAAMLTHADARECCERVKEQQELTRL